MRRALLAVFALAGLAACGSGSDSGGATARTYNASACVGDLMVLTIHPDTHKIDYDDRTTHETGTVDYTVAADGSYQITTPESTLVTAYELPGLALVMEGRKMGPSKDEPTLIVGVEQAPLALADLKGKSFNFMQFRTSEGGVEAGHIVFDATGGAAHQEYLPAAVLPGYSHDLFEAHTIASTVFSDDASTGTIRFTPAGDQPGTVFGTAGGSFAIDLPAGAMFGYPEAASSEFQAGNVGTYRMLFYERNDVTVVDGVETSSDPHVVKGTITVALDQTSEPIISVFDAGGKVMLDKAPIVPFVESSLYDAAGPAAGLSYASKGMFVFESPDHTPVLLVFTDHGLTFANFSLSEGKTDMYNYVYGFALKMP